MKVKDFREYFRWRRIVRNAWALIRFHRKGTGGIPFEVRLRNGTRLCLENPQSDYRIFRNIFLRDEYRLDRYENSRWNCVLDLGAHIGLFACRVAPRAQRVISYEPFPKHYALLVRNVEPFGHVTAVCEAVAADRGSAKIFHPHKERSSAQYSLFPSGEVHGNGEFTEVPATTLADIFERHQIAQCDLLKLDVEGAEYDILAEANAALLARVQRICGEYHHTAGALSDRSVEVLVARLQSIGFSVELVPHRKRKNHGRFFAERLPKAAASPQEKK
ncbi:MAG: FkbM family methyltransferase [Candidatus Sumerlaeia bacterium]|nr:FkbM family methyltransferase [Candidatus Sumerlaeia bacterium]